MNQPFNNDEYLLVEYASVLVKRWWVIAATLIVSILISFWYLVSPAPLRFLHSTVMEIGQGPDKTALFNQGDVNVKIAEVYIPIAKLEHAQGHDYEIERYSVEVKAPVDTKLLLLESYGTTEDTEAILAIQQRIAELVFQEHASTVELLKTQLQGQTFRAELALEDLQEQEQFFPAKYKQLDDTEKLVQQHINERRKLIDRLEENRSLALADVQGGNVQDGSLTTTLLVISSDIQENRRQLSALEERLNIDLQRERKTLEKEELNNKRQQRVQQQVIDESQLKIDSIKETRIISPPSRLLTDQEKRTSQLLIFSLTGLFLGIILAFLIEFMVKVRMHMRKL